MSEAMADLTLTTPLHPDLSGASSDEQLIELWLANAASVNTRIAYLADAKSFLNHVDKPLAAITVADLTGWVSTLEGADSTRARRVSAAKSLLSFAHRTGYLPFNVGAVVRPPKVRNEIAQRILSEAQIHKMIDRAEGRNRTFLRLLYASGARVSEVLALDWRHLQDGVLTLHGKGAKTRHVRIDATTVAELETVRGGPDEPIFTTKTGKRLAARDAHRLVRRAAKVARIQGNVSPHWIRHCAASHALDRRAPISLVQATLGHASVQTTGRYLHARPNEGLATYLSL